MKLIKIPKVEGEYFRVKFYRSKSRKYNIFLQKQNIAGIDVPKDTEIHIDWEPYFSNTAPYSDEIEIPVYYVNRMLKFVYLEKLRKNEL